MKVFSQSPKGYLDLWKWGFVALFVVVWFASSWRRSGYPSRPAVS